MSLAHKEMSPYVQTSEPLMISCCDITHRWSQEGHLVYQNLLLTEKCNPNEDSDFGYVILSVFRTSTCSTSRKKVSLRDLKFISNGVSTYSISCSDNLLIFNHKREKKRVNPVAFFKLNYDKVHSKRINKRHIHVWDRRGTLKNTLHKNNEMTSTHVSPNLLRLRHWLLLQTNHTRNKYVSLQPKHYTM